MDESTELDGGLHLRVAEFEIFERLLESLRTYNWYVDEDGRTWAWHFDVDDNVWRWFEQNPDNVMGMTPELERKDLYGSPRKLKHGAWSAGLWWGGHELGPYKRKIALPGFDAHAYEQQLKELRQVDSKIKRPIVSIEMLRQAHKVAIGWSFEEPEPRWDVITFVSTIQHDPPIYTSEVNLPGKKIVRQLFPVDPSLKASDDLTDIYKEPLDWPRIWRMFRQGDLDPSFIDQLAIIKRRD